MLGFMLAAGFGSRLWPLSDVRAKPAFPYRGVPLIVHTAELMAKHGVQEFYVNTHHLPESIHAALAPVRDRFQIHIVHEDTILGTAGALVNLRDQLRHDTVVVMNAKVVTDIDLGKVIAHASGVITMVCVPNEKREKFTHVQFDDNGTLQGFSNDLAPVAHPYTFTGIQILSPEVFEYLPGPGFSDTIKDVYPRVMGAGKTIHVEVAHESWAEFSTLARYRDLHVRGFIDPSAQVAGDARTQNAVIWENAKVGAGAQIPGCIVADGVEIPAGFHAENCALIQADRIADLRLSDRPGAQVVVGLLLAPIQ